MLIGCYIFWATFNWQHSAIRKDMTLFINAHRNSEGQTDWSCYIIETTSVCYTSFIHWRWKKTEESAFIHSSSCIVFFLFPGDEYAKIRKCERKALTFAHFQSTEIRVSSSVGFWRINLVLYHLATRSKARSVLPGLRRKRTGIHFKAVERVERLKMQPVWSPV